MTGDVELFEPQTGRRLATFSVEPCINLTDEDGAPLELERSVRELLRQRYRLETVPEQGDIRLRLTLRLLRRGTLRQSSDAQLERRVIAQAELEWLREDGSVRRHSMKLISEPYIDRASGDLEAIQNVLLARLADSLVVDLLEP